MTERLDEISLKALVASEISSAITYDTSELSKKRANALEYYQGEMSDLPVIEGRSSATSRDLSDTIGWMLPGIVRTFTASDQMAEFEPATPADEPFAKQATDYCNFVFWKDNPGYKILYNITHDSLLHGNGVGKVFWDDTEQCDYAEYTRMTEDRLVVLSQEEGVEVLTAEPNEEPDYMQVADPMTGQPVEAPVATYDVKIKRVTSRGKVKIESIPPEDFLMDKDATEIDEARFLAHRRAVTRSQLIRMGFDKEKVESLPADGLNDWQEEALARDEDRVDFEGNVSRSEEQVELFECYIRADADGDGESETLLVYYAGNAGGGDILEWDSIDGEQPFFDCPCEPVPHRWDARSVADDTTDIQRIKTALIRQGLDNLYASNMPQPVVPKGSVLNMDAVTNPQFGQPILVDPAKLPGGQLQWSTVPNIAPQAFQAIEFFDGVIEKRTGVSRTMMALDPEALQNQTATANQNARDAAYSQIELIARNHAELGWRSMFRKMLKLIVRHQDRARTIRLRDKWVEMDPRYWNANMDVTINVGLGTGSRDRDMAMLNTVLQNQMGVTDRLAAVAPDESVKMIPRVLNTLRKIAESAGLRSPDQYYPEFTDEQVSALVQRVTQMASKGDPKAAAEAQKAQAEMQIRAQEMQFKAQQAHGEMQMKREQMQMEMQLRREQLVAELDLKREQMAAEMQLKREMGMVTGFVKGNAALGSNVQLGGDPG